MVPVAINLPPPTSSNVIGLASAPSGCGNGVVRLSPPGSNGARIDGSMLGRSRRRDCLICGGRRQRPVS